MFCGVRAKVSTTSTLITTRHERYDRVVDEELILNPRVGWDDEAFRYFDEELTWYEYEHEMQQREGIRVQTEVEVEEEWEEQEVELEFEEDADEEVLAQLNARVTYLEQLLLPWLQQPQ